MRRNETRERFLVNRTNALRDAAELVGARTPDEVREMVLKVRQNMQTMETLHCLLQLWLADREPAGGGVPSVDDQTRNEGFYWMTHLMAIGYFQTPAEQPR